MVVDDLNIYRISPIPPEPYPILIVDADRMPAFATAAQFLKPVARRYP